MPLIGSEIKTGTPSETPPIVAVRIQTAVRGTLSNVTKWWSCDYKPTLNYNDSKYTLTQVCDYNTAIQSLLAQQNYLAFACKIIKKPAGQSHLLFSINFPISNNRWKQVIKAVPANEVNEGDIVGFEWAGIATALTAGIYTVNFTAGFANPTFSTVNPNIVLRENWYTAMYNLGQVLAPNNQLVQFTSHLTFNITFLGNILGGSLDDPNTPLPIDEEDGQVIGFVNPVQPKPLPDWITQFVDPDTGNFIDNTPAEIEGQLTLDSPNTSVPVAPTNFNNNGKLLLLKKQEDTWFYIGMASILILTAIGTVIILRRKR